MLCFLRPAVVLAYFFGRDPLQVGVSIPISGLFDIGV
jgi:hypothetical protein